MSTDRSPRDEQDRARETAEARARLLRLAEEQGVSPVTNFDDLLGEPEEDSEGVAEEVDRFLRDLREWRDQPSRRPLG